MKRGRWSKRLPPCSAFFQSMSKAMIKPMPACSCSLACPGCVAVLVAPVIMTCFNKTSLSLSRGCWKERLLPLLILNVPIKGFLFPELTSTVHKNASNKTRAFSQQNSTGGAAMIGTVTMWNRSKKQSLGPPAWDPGSLLVYSLPVHWLAL